MSTKNETGSDHFALATKLTALIKERDETAKFLLSKIDEARQAVANAEAQVAFARESLAVANVEHGRAVENFKRDVAALQAKVVPLADQRIDAFVAECKETEEFLKHAAPRTQTFSGFRGGSPVVETTSNFQRLKEGVRICGVLAERAANLKIAPLSADEVSARLADLREHLPPMTNPDAPVPEWAAAMLRQEHAFS